MIGPESKTWAVAITYMFRLTQASQARIYQTISPELTYCHVNYTFVLLLHEIRGKLPEKVSNGHLSVDGWGLTPEQVIADLTPQD